MLLKSRTRRARPAPRVHPAVDPATLPLPDGYTRTLLPAPDAPETHPAPAPTGAPAGPPLSSVVATVECASGALVHLHPAEYTDLSPAGEYTQHGYAWRCTRCPKVTTGYPASGFGRALGDAGRHHCEVHP